MKRKTAKRLRTLFLVALFLVMLFLYARHAYRVRMARAGLTHASEESTAQALTDARTEALYDGVELAAAKAYNRFWRFLGYEDADESER